MMVGTTSAQRNLQERGHQAEVMEAERRMAAMGARARAAGAVLALADPETKNRALHAAAAAIRAQSDAIMAANAKDMTFARARDVSEAKLDRLFLDADRIEAMARATDTIAEIEDPIGTVQADSMRPNGLRIQRVRVPLGVIGVIYESRPNVSADAGALCVRAGNAVILRCGSDCFHSAMAIIGAMRTALAESGLPADAIQPVETRSRVAVGAMLRASDVIDVIAPRGGRSLIERVLEEAQMPVFAHLDGVCHVYVHEAADPEKARAITLNAKMRRTAVCGAAETLLVDEAVADTMLPLLGDALREAECRMVGDARARAVLPFIGEAEEEDWSREYLDAMIAVRVVAGPDAAIAHINRYGSHHTDCIVTEDIATADIFQRQVDSAIVMHNASTQFADGGEFGMGGELGISTGRMHARGPVGAQQLTTYKYLVHGSGQCRP